MIIYDEFAHWPPLKFDGVYAPRFVNGVTISHIYDAVGPVTLKPVKPGEIIVHGPSQVVKPTRIPLDPPRVLHL